MDKKEYLRKETGIMKTTEYPGQEYKTNLNIVRDDKGFWTVSQRIVHRRTLDFIDWEETEANITTMSDDLEEALFSTAISSDEHMQNCEFDLFKAQKNLPKRGDLM
jgi:hypothetical protein